MSSPTSALRGASPARPPLDWDAVRAEFAIVGRRVPVVPSGERELVYLDHAASTHAPRSVLDTYLGFLANDYANVHRGTHHLSRRATERFEGCYQAVADFLGARLDHGAVVFTQNTTHAVDIASHVLADLPGVVLTTELEHHSNELPHRRRGPVLRVRARADGTVDLDHLAELLRANRVKLVAVTAGSNVTGVMPEVHTIAALAHAAGAYVLVDAAQALARVPIDVRTPTDPGHLDFVAAAGHKAYAPFGAGFLYGPRALLLAAPPYLPGGGTAATVTADGADWIDTPDRHHGGTPNIAGVVGMTASLHFLERIGRAEVRAHEVELIQAAQSRLAELDGVTVYGPGPGVDRLAVLTFNLAGVDEKLAAAVLSDEGALAVRNGRFCAHLYMDRLLADAHPDPARRPGGAVRASFGLYSRLEDVDRLVEMVEVVRSRRWAGRYREARAGVEAEIAARCADRWMEADVRPEA